tara:strand:- start:558 stop:1070 length:513 start_codon:yes stop_codon:yes gene_type:complete
MINNLLFLFTILILPFHEFHVTHTTLYYNDEKKSVEITIKVAIESLERSVENVYTEKLKLGTKNENKISQKILTEYFINHLKILTNKNKHEFKWVGKEISDNLHDIYLYFEIPNYFKNNNIERITIENTFFLELSTDQTNIVLIEFEDKDYNLTFTKDNYTQTIFLNSSK